MKTSQPARKPKVQNRTIDYSGYARSMTSGGSRGNSSRTASGCRLAHSSAQAVRKIPRSAAILDVGCGTGGRLLILAELGFSDLVGLDYTENMLRQAAVKVRGSSSGRVRLIRGDALRKVSR